MRTRAIRSALVSGLVTAALVLAGCAGEPGTPTPTTPAGNGAAPTSETATQSGALDNLVACELVTLDDLKFLEITDPGEDQGSLGGSGTSSCGWNRTSSPNRSALALDVTVRPEQRIDGVDPGSGTIADGDFEGRLSRQVRNFSGDGDCMLAISVGDSARVDIGVNDTNDDTDKACDAVNKIATIVEAKLPKG